MNLDRIEQAKRNQLRAKARLESALGALRHRLRPGNLAGEAWGGVRDKSANLAGEALQAVRKRPAAASVALGALALFLARAPLKRAAVKLFAGEEEGGEEDFITSRIETGDGKFSVSAPLVDAPVKEGVS